MSNRYNGTVKWFNKVTFNIGVNQKGEHITSVETL